MQEVGSIHNFVIQWQNATIRSMEGTVIWQLSESTKESDSVMGYKAWDDIQLTLWHLQSHNKFESITTDG